jgi:hypothetical protein
VFEHAPRFVSRAVAPSRRGVFEHFPRRAHRRHRCIIIIVIVTTTLYRRRERIGARAGRRIPPDATEDHPSRHRAKYG